VQAALAKFGLHVGNMKLNTQNEEGVGVHLFMCINLPVYLSSLWGIKICWQ
jgi:hypothetical protein